MSLSGSKYRYSNNCLDFLKRAVPLINGSKFEGSNPAPASIERKRQKVVNDKIGFKMFTNI